MKPNYEILPITTIATIIGPFLTIASILYVITNYCCGLDGNRIVCFAIEGAIAFVLILMAFFVIGIKNNKGLAETESSDFSRDCVNCIEEKMKDGFHDHGLLHLDEVVKYEKTLSTSSDPKRCKVLVYTSDLATELEAKEAVEENRKNGVEYVVLYFGNSKMGMFDKFREIYGEKKLVDLSTKDEFTNSFDGGLAKTLGFDITIFKDAEDRVRGFFAVDFVPKDKPERPFHDLNCNECNYGKENPNPFYKEFSPNIARQLFDQGIKFQ